MSEGKRPEEGATSSERADEVWSWWGLFHCLSYPNYSDQPTQIPGRFHQWIIAWQLFSLPWGEQNYRVGLVFSLEWLGVNISLLWWFQPSWRNSVFGWALCLCNVWIQLAWNFVSWSPLPQLQWLHHVFMCAERISGQSRVEKPPLPS